MKSENKLTEDQIEKLHRAAETLRDNARTSFWSALDATNTDAAAIFKGAAETYAQEANAVCAAMRALGIAGVAPDFGDDEFERMKQRRKLRDNGAG